MMNMKAAIYNYKFSVAFLVVPILITLGIYTHLSAIKQTADLVVTDTIKI